MQFKTFSDFYPFYLRERSNINSRRLHFLGTCGVVALLLLFFFTGNLVVLAMLPVVGYGFAWAGHLIYEKSAPKTMKYPVWSILGDFLMFWEILAGKVKVF